MRDWGLGKRFSSSRIHYLIDGSHHAGLAASELPECLTWLWRDYDPATTEQIYEQRAEEKSKPPFRVRIYNR